MYMVSGSQSIQAVLNSPHLTTKPYKTLAVRNMNKVPKDALEHWLSDDSGHHTRPEAGSSTGPNLRIEYLAFSTATKFLAGEGLQALTDRFVGNLTQQILTRRDTPLDQWEDVPDLFKLMRDELFDASVKAMYGTRIFQVNRNLREDFWAWSESLPKLAKGYPRWLVPSAYRIRDKMFDNIKRWHTQNSLHFRSESSESMAYWSPDYGAEFFKLRNSAILKMPKMAVDGAVAEDLGMMWAANGNAIPNAYWMMAEILRDSNLLNEVRAVITACRTDTAGGSPDFDIPKLCGDPLLQSVYAESMRMHNATFLMRGVGRESFDLNGWEIPPASVMIISAHYAQMDPGVWAPEPDSIPADIFFPGRFLKASDQCDRPRGLEFSLKCYAGSWLPYGTGPRMCPGRHFAKQEIIVGCAIMLSLFDIEMTGSLDEFPGHDTSGFGFGVLWPTTSFPVRIRRRAA